MTPCYVICAITIITIIIIMKRWIVFKLNCFTLFVYGIWSNLAKFDFRIAQSLFAITRNLRKLRNFDKTSTEFHKTKNGILLNIAEQSANFMQRKSQLLSKTLAVFARRDKNHNIFAHRCIVRQEIRCRKRGVPNGGRQKSRLILLNNQRIESFCFLKGWRYERENGSRLPISA